MSVYGLSAKNPPCNFSSCGKLGPPWVTITLGLHFFAIDATCSDKLLFQE